MKISEIEHNAIYKAMVCNRCGEVHLRKYIGTSYLDGGFTKIENFEACPEGWKSHDETGMLCPNCESEYQKHFMQFMQKVQKMMEEPTNDQP